MNKDVSHMDQPHRLPTFCPDGLAAPAPTTSVLPPTHSPAPLSPLVRSSRPRCPRDSLCFRFPGHTSKAPGRYLPSCTAQRPCGLRRFLLRSPGPINSPPMLMCAPPTLSALPPCAAQDPAGDLAECGIGRRLDATGVHRQPDPGHGSAAALVQCLHRLWHPRLRLACRHGRLVGRDDGLDAVLQVRLQNVRLGELALDVGRERGRWELGA